MSPLTVGMYACMHALHVCLSRDTLILGCTHSSAPLLCNKLLSQQQQQQQGVGASLQQFTKTWLQEQDPQPTVLAKLWSYSKPAAVHKVLAASSAVLSSGMLLAVTLTADWRLCVWSVRTR
jgi:hypothetical protein